MDAGIGVADASFFCPSDSFWRCPSAPIYQSCGGVPLNFVTDALLKSSVQTTPHHADAMAFVSLTTL